MAKFHKIRSICGYLSTDLCKQIVTALVLSHLDYANALYNGLPDITVKKLQGIQNIAAKFLDVKNLTQADNA